MTINRTSEDASSSDEGTTGIPRRVPRSGVEGDTLGHLLRRPSSHTLSSPLPQSTPQSTPAPSPQAMHLCLLSLQPTVEHSPSADVIRLYGVRQPWRGQARAHECEEEEGPVGRVRVRPPAVDQMEGVDRHCPCGDCNRQLGERALHHLL
eukprot:CAMPEP_0181257388 /NCGR_PEP_ID=MMETSP1096-20121128/50217_1 /TAXON_ID=156174 ORGANISM="Chrysochromulina ericina, Strain CCMP281" /NCGR_SAMPLE_ID=MMETSP1096 /ASSEMBLY_ACC=CAM_ASM_000453 /LENGTH=149 /DNA_ID=CAMNT_0023355701 /DNA_START=224 /DNA_END=670 /DNA_ORIENTATION=+